MTAPSTPTAPGEVRSCIVISNPTTVRPLPQPSVWISLFSILRLPNPFARASTFACSDPRAFPSCPSFQNEATSIKVVLTIFPDLNAILHQGLLMIIRVTNKDCYVFHRGIDGGELFSRYFVYWRAKASKISPVIQRMANWKDKLEYGSQR